MDIGSVNYTATLDRSDFDRGIRQLERDYKNLTFAINPVVNHRPLFDLNRHLDIKERHWDKARATFRKPLIAHIKYQQTGDVPRPTNSNNFTSKIKHEVSVSTRESSMEAARELGKEIKEVAKETKEVVKAMRSTKPSAISKLLSAPLTGLKTIATGAYEGIGKGLTDNLTQGILEELESRIGGKLGSTKAIGQSLAKNIADNVNSSVNGLYQAIEKEIEAELQKPTKKQNKNRLTVLQGLKKAADSANQKVSDFVDPELRKTEQRAVLSQRQKRQQQTTRESSKGLQIQSQLTDNLVNASNALAKIEINYAETEAIAQKQLAIINKELADLEESLASIENKLLQTASAFDTASPSEQAALHQEAKKLEQEIQKLQQQYQAKSEKSQEITKIAQKISAKKQSEIKTVFQEFEITDKNQRQRLSKIANSQVQYTKGKSEVNDLENYITRLTEKKDKFSSLFLDAAISGNDAQMQLAETALAQVEKEITRAEKLKNSKASSLDKLAQPAKDLISEQEQLNREVVAHLTRDAKSLTQAQKTYNALVKEAIEASGIDYEQVKGYLPKLEKTNNPNLAGSYSAKRNTIKINAEDYNQLESGEISQELIESVIHETRHALQMVFGKLSKEEAAQAKGILGQLNTLDMLSPDDYKRLAKQVIGSVNFAKQQGLNAKVVLPLEEDAYTFAQQNISRLNKKYGVRRSSGAINGSVQDETIPLPELKAVEKELDPITLVPSTDDLNPIEIAIDLSDPWQQLEVEIANNLPPINFTPLSTSEPIEIGDTLKGAIEQISQTVKPTVDEALANIQTIGKSFNSISKTLKSFDSKDELRRFAIAVRKEIEFAYSEFEKLSQGLPKEYSRKVGRQKANITRVKNQIDSILNEPDLDPDPTPPSPRSRPNIRAVDELSDSLLQVSIESEKASKRIQELEQSLSELTTPAAGKVMDVPLQDINFDPKRFQYKMMHTGDTGASGSLTGVGKWNPNLAGVVQLWTDPKDGKTYVINGHNRASLAKNLGVDKITGRYIEASNAKEARAIGAMTNIAEGRGTPLDAAKFFRDMGIKNIKDLKDYGIPLKEKIATQGFALSQLPQHLFDKTITGDIGLERAIAIGESGLGQSQMNDLVKMIEDHEKKRKTITNETIKELIDIIKSSETVQTQQFSLFGASFDEQSLALEKAQLQSFIKRKLSREKKLFGTVSRSSAAKDLEKGGNQIDVEHSSAIAQQAETGLRVFDQFKNLSGDISKLINQAAKEIASGGNRKQIEDALYANILAAIPKLAKGQALEEVGQNLTEGFVEGIESGIDDAQQSMFELTDAVIETAENKLEVASPSKLFKRFGKWVAQGFGLGVKEETANTKKTMQDLLQTPDLTRTGNRKYDKTINKTLEDIKKTEEALKELDQSLQSSVTENNSDIDKLLNRLHTKLQKVLQVSDQIDPDYNPKRELTKAVRLAEDLGQKGLPTEETDAILKRLKEKEKELSKALQYADETLAGLEMGIHPDNLRGMGKRNDDYGIGEFVNKLKESHSIIGKTIGLVKSLFAVFIGYQVFDTLKNSVAEFGKESFDTALQIERLSVSLDFSTAGKGIEKLKLLEQQSNDLGTNFLTAAQNYQQLAAATLNTPLEFQTDSIFSGIQTGLAVRGADTQQQERALLAITQLASKGRASLEEINGQLAEAMPGALTIAARSMGKTTAEFIKMVESGEVLAEDLLPKLATQLQLESTGGLARIDDSAFAQIARFQNQVTLLKKELGSPLLDISKLGLLPLNAALGFLADNGKTVIKVIGALALIFAVDAVLSAIAFQREVMKLSGNIITLESVTKATLKTIKGLSLTIASLAVQTVVVYALIEAFGQLFRYINAGSEEVKRALKESQDSYNQILALRNLPLPQEIQRKTKLKGQFELLGASDIPEITEDFEKINQILGNTKNLLDDTKFSFSPETTEGFKRYLEDLRTDLANLKIDLALEIDPNKAREINKKIAELKEQETGLIQSQFPEIGGINQQLEALKIAKTRMEQLLGDPRFSDAAKVYLETINQQIGNLEKRQEAYNDAIEVANAGYKRVQQTLASVERILSNATFKNQADLDKQTIDATRRYLSGKTYKFELDIELRRASLVKLQKDLSTAIAQASNLSGLLQERLTGSINQRLTKMMSEELGGKSFAEALADNLISPEAIANTLSTYEDINKQPLPTDLKAVLELSQKYQQLRGQILTTEKDILITQAELSDIQRQRARLERDTLLQEQIAAKKVNLIKTNPLGGKAFDIASTRLEIEQFNRQLANLYKDLADTSLEPNEIRQQIAQTKVSIAEAQARLIQQLVDIQETFFNLARQIEDLELQSARESRGLLESYKDFQRELKNSFDDAKRQIEEVNDQLQNQKIKNDLYKGLTPGLDSWAKQLTDIVSGILDRKVSGRSRSRSLEGRIAEIEGQYIQNLRRIRELQEQQIDIERTRKRAIEDLSRQVIKEFGRLPNAIKEMVDKILGIVDSIKFADNNTAIAPLSATQHASTPVISPSKITSNNIPLSASPESLIPQLPSSLAVVAGNEIITPNSTNLIRNAAPNYSNNRVNTIADRPTFNQKQNLFDKALQKAQKSYDAMTKSLNNLGKQTGNGAVQSLKRAEAAVTPYIKNLEDLIKAAVEMGADSKYVKQLKTQLAVAKNLAKQVGSIVIPPVAKELANMRDGVVKTASGTKHVVGESFRLAGDEIKKGVQTGSRIVENAINKSKQWADRKVEQIKKNPTFINVRDYGDAAKDLFIKGAMGGTRELKRIYNNGVDWLKKNNPFNRRSSSILENTYASASVSDVGGIYEPIKSKPRYQIPTGLEGYQLPKQFSPNLTPLPSLNYQELKDQATQLNSEQKKLVETQRELNAELDQADVRQNIEELARFMLQMDSEAKALVRTVAQLNIETINLARSAKGYLTTTEEIAKARQDTASQYDDAIFSREQQKLDATIKSADYTVAAAALRNDLANPNLTEPERLKITEAIAALEQQSATATNQVALLNNQIAILQEFKPIAVNTAHKDKGKELENNFRERRVQIESEYYRKLSEVADPFTAGQLRIKAATLETTLAFDQQRQALQKMAQSYPEYAEQFSAMLDQLNQTESLTLQQIAIDNNEWLQLFSSGATDALTGFFESAQTGFKDLGQVGLGVLKSILNQLNQMIVKWLVMKMVMAIAGGGGGAAASGFSGKTAQLPSFGGGSTFGAGATFGLDSSIGSFNSGGPIGNYARGGPVDPTQHTDSPTTLGLSVMAAMKKEGHGARAIVAHDGEQILTDRNGDAQFFRFLERTGKWQKLKLNRPQRNYDVSHFNNGGPVGNGNQIRGNAGNGSGSTYITNNHTTNIEVKSPDANSFRKSRNQIAQEERREQDRANRFKR